ncbi:MAG: HYR domain-containing protein [bacterium]
MKRLGYLLSLVAVSLLIATPGVIGLSQDAHVCGGHFCYGKDAVPIDIVLSAPFASITPGAAVGMQATITAEADLDDVDIVIEADGADLAGTTRRYVGPLAMGQNIDIDVPVSYGTAERNAVIVAVSARDPNSGETIGRREGVYTIFRDGRSYSGHDGLVALEHSSIQDDYDQGFIDEQEYQARMKEALAAEGVSDQTPRPAPPLAPVAVGMGKLEPVLPEGEISEPLAPEGTAGTITVEGTVLFTDENGNTHPAYGVQVEVWDEDLLFDDFLAADAIGTDGQYSFTLNNDDGIAGGGLDIFVKFVTTNEAVEVKDGGVYENETGVHYDLSDGATVTENFTYGNTGDGPAASVHAAASYIAAYVKFELNGGSALAHMPVVWPGSNSWYTGSQIEIVQDDRWDWDVVGHEYGHYVMDHFNFEDNPGGRHSSANCSADVRETKDIGIRLAWGESWPTYFSLSGQAVLNLAALGMPRVGDTTYQDMINQTLTYSLENNTEPLYGDDNERSLMRVFWDLFDTAVDGRDNVSFDDKDLFDVFDAAGSTTLTEGWAALMASALVPDNQTELAIGAMSSDYGIGPVPIDPPDGAVVSPGSADFSWTPAVGCGTVAGGDEWDLVFYNPLTYAKILTISGLSATNTSLSAAQLSTLLAGSANHEVLWAVQGYNTTAPVTGPYLGANSTVLINQPPVAVAGADVTAECASHTGTDVMLDGTGSSDPDGDPLTYSWSPPELFDDPSSPTPTGTFELGSVTVTLTVSDGLQDDSDEVEVTIVDTTPPEMTCPADITVECTGYCGTTADDPQLASFFNHFEATDVCCEDLETELDNPDCFSLGETTVTFTATDCSGNVASCSAKVTVVDTTPPEIDLTLSRDVLWPPNHMMADITAVVVVSDICCETPIFYLTSIESDEPDNGKGDGNTVGDIQYADYGTADTAFQLRAERMGGEDGRVYTVIYTAEDCSGNTASDTAYVRVPHDRGASALASTGFEAGRIGFDTSVERFVLIVPSREAEYEIDDSGNEVLVEEAFDATQLDVTRTYVGNVLDVKLPVEVLEIDNNADGLMDIALYYSAPAVNAILAASTATEENNLKKNVSYGPIGLHYVDASGIDRLVPNIFLLGDPVPLAPQIEIGRGGASEPEAPEEPKDPEIATGEVPKVTALLSAYPNPFNPTTTIPFSLAEQGHVSLLFFVDAG